MSEQTYDDNLLTEIKQAWIDAQKGWAMDQGWASDDGSEFIVGSVMDDEAYPVITINTAQYFEPHYAPKIAMHIITATPATVLAMAEQIEVLDKQRGQLLAALTSTRRELQACQAVIHLAGSFDPAYVTGAKAAIREADAAIAAVQSSVPHQSTPASRYPLDLVESDGGEA